MINKNEINGFNNNKSIVPQYNVTKEKYNPEETLQLPGTGYIAMGNQIVSEIISVNLMGNIDNWESGILWFQFPMIKRGNAGQQVLFGLNPGGYPAIKNYGITGPIKISGYVVYTR